MASSLPNSPWLCAFKPTKTHPSSLYTNPRNSTFKPINLSSDSSSSSSSDTSVEGNKPVVDPVKLAFEKAKAYKKKSKTNPNPQIIQQQPNSESEKKNVGDGSKSKDGSSDAFRVAMEKVKDYEKNRGELIEKRVESNEAASGSKGGGSEISGVEERVKKKEKLTVSSMDFVGLNFSDKRSSRGLPPGLVPTADPFPDTDLSEVEIIVGDTSKFEDKISNPTAVDENPDVYKPKVSTWGVYPRPSDISKTYGGGKVIRPGEALETAEDKAVKEARTRQLLAAYKKKVGLNIDPKLKSECQKVLNDGDSLMDRGMLEDALPFYESVMEKLPFQTELYGLAALQWSICQDSLTRMSDARVMYEKLQSHPNVEVRKKAKQFVFGFQAMEMLKVKLSTPPTSTGYQDYFDAFVKDKATYSSEEKEANEGSKEGGEISGVEERVKKKETDSFKIHKDGKPNRNLHKLIFHF